ncbi:MAG TPA: CBS domain-containing protein [Gemmatimonadales bacterium]|nr:CBS domain-containing protein [Gemmatimonadales bacterium]
MSVGKICSRAVITASPDEPVRVAARRMAQHQVGTLVILRTDGTAEAIGIVTDRDVTVRCVAVDLDPNTTPVSKIMTQPPRTVDQGASIEDAILQMAKTASRRLVVTGERNQLVGILSLDDVLDLLIGELGPIGRLLERQQPYIPT